jgi:phage baseplate assembly protein V
MNASLSRWINPLKNRIMLMIGRCVLTAVDDSTGYQVAQILAGDGEVLGKLLRLQNFGFTSYPKPGAAGVVAFVGGNRGNGLVLAMDDARYREKLQEGEAAVYNAFGAKVVLKVDGSIVATPAPGKPFKVSGNFEASGTIHSDIDVTAGITNTSLKTHVHPDPVSGFTGAPTP